MRIVEKGNFVKVSYTGRLESGEVFDSTDGCEPVEIEIGSGNLIKGFEDALLGMTLNEKKTFSLTPDEAYGQRNDALEQSFSRSDTPDDFQPKVGEIVGLQSPQGEQVLATVKHVDNEKITVDLNHPLAGKALTFDVAIDAINDVASQGSDCGCGCSCSCS